MVVHVPLLLILEKLKLKNTVAENASSEELGLSRQVVARHPDSEVDHPIIGRCGSVLMKLNKKGKIRAQGNDRPGDGPGTEDF